MKNKQERGNFIDLAKINGAARPRILFIFYAAGGGGGGIGQECAGSFIYNLCMPERRLQCFPMAHQALPHAWGNRTVHLFRRRCPCF